MAEAGLAVERLTVRRGPRAVVEDVSFVAPAGAVTALLGPNGAGKTTVLKAVAGLLPHEGRILLGGQDADALGRRERARRVAYVPQHSALDAPVPVREVVAQGRFPHQDGLRLPRPADEEAIAAALARTDTAALADRPFSRLSYGERRRVLLARALATGAPNLLLDEPTAALDVGHTLALLEVLRGLARAGATVVLVLHQLQEVVDVAERAVLLAAGRAVATGRVADVLAPATVRRVYGVELVPGAHFGFRLAPPGPPERP
jgi:iron complex transport system ATP-binding protein